MAPHNRFVALVGLAVAGLVLMGCISDDPDRVPVVTTPTSTAAQTATATPAPSIPDLPYAEAIAVAVADVEAFWAREFPAVFGAEFEPVADVIGYRPSEPETVPTCGGDPFPAYNAVYCSLNDIIGYDDEALFPELYESLGDVAVASVLAHEYGHAMAHRLGINVPTIMGEQQADCMAGAWVGSLAERGGSNGLVVTDEDLNSAIAANLQVADPIGMPSMTPGAHGTGFDRVRAFGEGFEGGVKACSGYAVRPPDLVDLPFDLSSSTPANEPLDVLVPALAETLEQYWGFVFADMEIPELRPFSGTDDNPPSCNGKAVPEAVGGAIFCRPDNAVHYDTAAQQVLWDNTGDAAATYGLVHAWTQAVVVHLGTIDTPADVVTAADCLAGVWHRQLVEDYVRLLADPDARPRYSHFVAAGDIDEILAGLLLSTPVGPDGAEAKTTSPFARARAFGDGYLEGESTCALDGQPRKPTPSEPATPTPTAPPDPDTNPPPPFDPTAVDPEPGWTTFTAADGLPGDDIFSVDLNMDGTTWAMVALDRVANGDPGALGFARFDGETWTSFPIPEALDGPMQLASGPQGTAWVVGGGQYAGNRGLNYGGTPGVWYFDGRSWRRIQGDAVPGEPLAVRGATVDGDGTLWVTGLADVTTSATGLLRHNTRSWMTFELPAHLFDCIDCHGVYLGPNQDVWIQYGDYDELTNEQVGYIARLDGDTWAPIVAPGEVFDVRETTAGLGFDYDRAWGLDGIFVTLVVAGVEQEAAGVPLPDAGDVVAFGVVTFDGESWSEELRGSLSIAAGHTLTPASVAERGSVGGPTGLSVSHSDGAIYVAGLGGLQLIDAAGAVTTLTADDGLASNTTQNVTVGPDGTIWVATDNGINRYVPG